MSVSNDLVLYLNQMDRISDVSHNSDPHEAHIDVHTGIIAPNSSVFLFFAG